MMLLISIYLFQEDRFMTKENKHYADKHGKNAQISPELANRIREKAAEGKIPCAVAFKTAEGLKIEPAEIGLALDLLDIKISKCQMGIFGYNKENKIAKPVEYVAEPLEKAIRKNLSAGKLACRNAWQIAETFDIGKMDVTAACDSLGIKISPCQLGAF
jgi:hypothetical protein